jgi:anti-sigma B factor antagonist
MKFQCKITTAIENNIPQIIIEGEMTSDADSEVKEAFNDVRSQTNAQHYIFNFGQTSYINSSGIATLIKIIQTMDEFKGKAYFVGMSEHFKKVMEIVGLSDFVEIYTNLDEAYTAIE